MNPCYYGIDTPTRDDLLAANHSIPEMNEFIGSDSLEFITLANLRSAIQLDGECCDACLTGSYPRQHRSCWEPQAAAGEPSARTARQRHDVREFGSVD